MLSAEAAGRMTFLKAFACDKLSIVNLFDAASSFRVSPLNDSNTGMKYFKVSQAKTFRNIILPAIGALSIGNSNFDKHQLT